MLLTDTDLKAAAYVSERLRVSVESRVFEARGLVMQATASFGVACTDTNDGVPTPEELIHAADGALYASKDAGRNCVHLVGEEGLIHGSSEAPPEGQEPQ